MTAGLVILGAAVLVLLGLLVWMWRRYENLVASQARQLRDAREQSVRQSRSGLLGKATEQIAPMLPEFCERFSPSDARFIGAPVDYVVFDGLHRGEVERVIFVEIKSGRPDLNKNERSVRQAIQERRVGFEVLSLGDGSPRWKPARLVEAAPDDSPGPGAVISLADEADP
jgi:predicted Holliday junction resolvase-like endonuclease